MVGLDYGPSRPICTYVLSALTAPLACFTNLLHNHFHSQLTKIGKKICFQAMHVVLSMQHLGKGDANARRTYSALTKFHPLRVKVFPTPANYLELAGINVYVPATAIRIAITKVQRKKDDSMKLLTVRDKKNLLGNPTLKSEMLSTCLDAMEEKVTTTYVGLADDGVPRRRDLGQRAASQVRPENVVVQNGGSVLAQPRDSGSLERFANIRELKQVPLGMRQKGLCLVTVRSPNQARSKEKQFLTCLRNLSFIEESRKRLLEASGIQSRKTKRSIERPSRAADPKVLTCKDSTWKGQPSYVKKHMAPKDWVRKEGHDEDDSRIKVRSEKNRLARNVVESWTLSTFYLSRDGLSDDHLSAQALRRWTMIQSMQHDMRDIVPAASRSSGGRLENDGQMHRRCNTKNDEAINLDDTVGQDLESSSGFGATRPINHSPLAFVTTVDNIKRPDVSRPASKIVAGRPNPSRATVSH